MAFPQQVTPAHITWLSETSVPVRSIRFSDHPKRYIDADAHPELEVLSGAFARSTHMLAASTSTLEVRYCLHAQTHDAS